MDSKEVWAERAERAYELWGDALDAQIEHLNQENEALPANKQLPIDDPILRYNEHYIDMAAVLFDRSLSRHATAEELEKKGAGFVRTEDKVAAAREAERKQPKKDKKPKWKFTAFTRSSEEIAEVTDGMIGEMVTALDGIHASYLPEKTAEQEARGWLSKKTEIFAKKGEQQYKKSLSNRDIAGVDDMLQAILWIGHVNGPKQAPRKQTPGERVRYVLDMINLGKVSPEDRIDAEQLWKLVDMAAEEGLVMGEGAQDPKLTDEGLEMVQTVFESIDEVRSRGPIF